jgi:hypothetical protein
VSEAPGSGQEAHGFPITAVERKHDPHPLAVVATDLKAVTFIHRNAAVMAPLVPANVAIEQQAVNLHDPVDSLVTAPQIAGRGEPFRSAIRQHLKGHTQGLEDLAIDMLARGLSVRDIEDAFKGRTVGCCYRRPRRRGLGSGCGRITRRSRSVT